MRIYIVCPVRRRTPEQDRALLDYARRLKEAGHEVFLPGRDSTIPEREENVTALVAVNFSRIRISDEVHVYYAANTDWSLFDIGGAHYGGKVLRQANPIAITKAALEDKSLAIFLRQNALPPLSPDLTADSAGAPSDD